MTLEADFVTHVPIPVVTITPREVSLEPYELGLEDIIQYNITNHGLIRADDVGFQLPTGRPFLEFSTDIEEFGSLEALTSIIVPVKVTRIEGREKRNVAACILYAIRVAYSYVCGDVQHRSATALLRGFGQVCGGSNGDGTGHRGRYRLIGPPRRSGDPTSISSTYTPTTIHCDNCLISAIGCLPIPLPGFSCFHFSFSLGYNFGSNPDRSPFNPTDIADWSSLIGCILSVIPVTAPISGLFCLPSLLRDCLGVDTTIGRRR